MRKTRLTLNERLFVPSLGVCECEYEYMQIYVCAVMRLTYCYINHRSFFEFLLPFSVLLKFKYCIPIKYCRRVSRIGEKKRRKETKERERNRSTAVR